MSKQSNQLKKVKQYLNSLIKWPAPGTARRTQDGYPSEMVYDEFAYRRLVDSYRDGIKTVIEEIEQMESKQ